MRRLNSWNLTRDKFCLMWIESKDCGIEDVLEKGRSVKGAKISRVYILKFKDMEDGSLELVGKWDKCWEDNYEPVLEMIGFIGDSYLVSLWGDRYLFRMIDECLGRNKLPSLDRRYVMDIEEVFSWVPDREWADVRLGEIREIYGERGDEGEKLGRMMEWFKAYMLPLLKNGFK